MRPGTIPQPELLDPEGLELPSKQRELVPLTAQGLLPAEMACNVYRRVDVVRQDLRGLKANLGAESTAHVITRAWQYRLITAEQAATLAAYDLPG